MKAPGTARRHRRDHGIRLGTHSDGSPTRSARLPARCLTPDPGRTRDRRSCRRRPRPPYSAGTVPPGTPDNRPPAAPRAGAPPARTVLENGSDTDQARTSRGLQIRRQVATTADRNFLKDHVHNKHDRACVDVRRPSRCGTACGDTWAGQGAGLARPARDPVWDDHHRSCRAHRRGQTRSAAGCSFETPRY